MNAYINIETRSVEPNKLTRISRRADAAASAVKELRARASSRPLLLTTSGSVNWRSGGLSDPIDVTAPSDAVWTLDTDHGKALLTNVIEAPRLEADFRVSELGWDVVSYPWHEASGHLKAACEYAGVGAEQLLSDVDGIGTNVRYEVVKARLSLSESEEEELRELGRLVGWALSVGIDSWRPGVSSDFDVAGVISGAVESQGAKAVCLIVGGDDRLRRLRHPLAIGDVVHDALMAVVVARRRGLHVAATRTCVARSDDQIVELMRKVAVVNDAVLAASVSGGTWGQSIDALAQGYATIGQPDAWREHWQGGPIGFEQREFELAPSHHDSVYWSLERRTHNAVAWNPSLAGGAKIEDTYLVSDSLELVSATPGWPTRVGPAGIVHSALKVLD